MAHHNVEFFAKITRPYKSLMLDELRRRKHEEQQHEHSQEHSHSHSHTHAQSAHDNGPALTVFRYAVEEWSEKQPSYVHRVIDLMQTHWAPTSGGKVLVVGCRMGRMQY
jgi:hypothetical protein